MKISSKNVHVVIAVALAGYLGSLSAPAEAGLEDTLDSMFASNATGAEAYEAGKANTFFGGRASFKSPVRGFSLYHLSPPRVDAGCSGLDLYGGSFSFIDRSQFEQLIKRIGANALGYAMKLALKEMCAECANELTELMSNIQKLNMGMLNTCTVAKAAVDPFFEEDSGAAEELADQFSMDFSREETESEDDFAARMNLQASQGSEDFFHIETNPYMGNTVWKALSIANPATGLYPFSEGTTEAEQRRLNLLLMSIGGTAVYNLEGPSPAEKGKPDIKQPLLTVEKLYDPEENLQRYDCVGGYGLDECRTLATTDLEFEGIRPYVERLIVGDPDVDGDGSIVDAMVHQSEASDEAKRLYSHMSTPLRLLRELEGNPRVLQAVARDLVDPIANQLMVEFGLAIEDAMRNSYTNIIRAVKPKIWDESIERWHNDLMSRREQIEPGVVRINRLAAFVRNYQRYNPTHGDVRPDVVSGR